jgi:hypothetical protein
MKAHHLTGLCCAAALACTVAASAQTSAQQGTSASPAQTPGGSTSSDSQDSSTATDASRSVDSGNDGRIVTIVGCVQPESAALGRSGAGSGNEFVLTNTTMGTADSASSATAGTSSTARDDSPTNSDKPDTDASGTPSASSETATSGATAGAVGTSGTMAGSPQGPSYSLAGSREHELARFVGKRVEITGTLEHDRGGASSGAVHGAPDREDATGSSAGDAGRSTPDATESGSEGLSASASVPKLDITRYREIGGSCSGSTSP